MKRETRRLHLETVSLPPQLLEVQVLLGRTHLSGPSTTYCYL